MTPLELFQSVPKPIRIIALTLFVAAVLFFLYSVFFVKYEEHFADPSDRCECEAPGARVVIAGETSGTQSSTAQRSTTQSTTQSSTSQSSTSAAVQSGQAVTPEQRAIQSALSAKPCPADNLNLADMNVQRITIEYLPKSIQKDQVPQNINVSVQTQGETQEKRYYDDCTALRMAGFQPDWTKSKLRALVRTDDGRVLLQEMNDRFIKLSGRPELTEDIITKCYPEYVDV